MRSGWDLDGRCFGHHISGNVEANRAVTTRYRLTLPRVLILGIALTIAVVALVDGWRAAARVTAWVCALAFMATAFAMVAILARAKQHKGAYPPGGIAATTFLVWGCMFATMVVMEVGRADGFPFAVTVPAGLGCFAVGFGLRAKNRKEIRNSVETPTAGAENKRPRTD
jgi:hypothetical protein